MSLLLSFAITQWRKKALQRLEYARRIGIAETSAIQIDDTGYHDEKPGLCRSTMAWTYFTSWIEKPRVFVMGRDLNYIMLPKAVLTGEQQDELRLLLNAKLGPERRD